MSEKKKDNKTGNKDNKGVTVEKDDFSEWFTQLMIKADLADYTKVSGCMVFKPASWAIWENMVRLVDDGIKKLGVRNVYFPLFIPESLLTKEKEHVEGFTPEVAWVTHAGNTKLNERLAVRPTSEAIMYDSFSKWIRSWRDLPMKLNQWSNVVRWEFKHPTPFLRTREFVFNEGHTVFSNEKEAEAECDQILGLYKEICDNYLALPSLIGKKTDKEKFAGAVYTKSMEFYMPNGKAIQGPDFHFDGQNFARAYDIKFLDKNSKENFAWQNTWAFSTRMLGIMFAIHSDNKGLIIPPRVAQHQVVIVPIFNEDNQVQILKKADSISKLIGQRVIVDERTGYSPGWKFNEWELKGVPLRVEVGPKDIEKKQVVLVRRDSGKKEIVLETKLKNRVLEVLEEIQSELYSKAEKLLKGAIAKSDKLDELKALIDKKKIVLSPLCNSRSCEEDIKLQISGAKVLNIPDKQPNELDKSKCILCDKKAKYFGYVGKSY